MSQRSCPKCGGYKVHRPLGKTWFFTLFLGLGWLLFSPVIDWMRKPSLVLLGIAAIWAFWGWRRFYCSLCGHKWVEGRSIED